MIEKFTDYEKSQWIEEEGTFRFDVTDAELKESSTGNPMVVFTVSSDKGQSVLYFSLTPAARWKYNSFIKACMKLDTREKIDSFRLDYETVHNDLIGKTFIGEVEKDFYTKVVKQPDENGLFVESVEEKVSYKIKKFSIA